MSLTLTALPNPEQQLRSLQQELYTRNRQLNEAEEALRQERAKNAAIERGVQELRQVLGPLYAALQHVFGEIDAMGVADSRAPSTSKSSPVWEDWKRKLGGAAAKIIDILHLHGELTQTQIRIHIGTSRMQTVYDAVSKLNRAGIINKNGGKISLKEL